MLKPDAGDLDTYRDITFRERVEIPALSLLDSEPSMESWWYLHGNSPRTCTLRKQLELACSGNHPVHLIVPHGAPAIQLATWIFHERFQAQAVSVRRDPPITIECKWMDKDLLSSVCEWIDDIRKQGRSPEVVIHLIDQLAPELREPLAEIATKQRWNAIITSSVVSSEQASRNSPHWSRWIATFDVQTIELQPIAQRTEEIESLLLAWLRKHPGFRWNQAFLDALLAYAWPSDAEEFDQALNESIQSCQGESLRGNLSSDDSRSQEQESKSQERLLDETHLPISLRTFPSHIERLSPPEPIVLDDELESYERKLIERALRDHPRNNTAAAKALGISRARLLRRMQQWGLGSPQSTPRSTDQVVFEEIDSDE
jgi:DNA-binding protein Fis